MLVKLEGKSLRGVLAMAKAQGVETIRRCLWNNGTWKAYVELPQLNDKKRHAQGLQ